MMLNIICNFMKTNSIKLTRVKNLASRLKGDPRSVFYGDVTVQVDPEDASAAIGHESDASDVVKTAIVSDEPNELVAADKLAAYNAMTDTDRAARTLLPPLATWNAMVIVNPMLGKVLAKALDYMLLKCLNDYPYEGKPVPAVVSGNVATVTIDYATISGSPLVGAGRYIALPFFRFTIASSTLNAAPGSQISIDIQGTNAEGQTIHTNPGMSYSFQRISNTEAVVGIYIPTTVVATRTLPFLPIAGSAAGERTEGSSDASDRTIVITFTGVAETDQVTVTIPGYATAELKEISAMYNLPSGMIR